MSFKIKYTDIKLRNSYYLFKHNNLVYMDSKSNKFNECI